MLFILLILPSFSALTSTNIDEKIIGKNNIDKIGNANRGNKYNGYLRVYIVEIESR